MHHLILLIPFLVFFACRSTPPSDLANETKQEVLTEKTETLPSPPFAAGVAEGITWELRLNRAQCAHPPHPSTYCKESDRSRVAEESGVEKKLLSWVKDPAVKSIKLSYFTFGSSSIAKALCEEAQTRALDIEIYLQTSFVESLEKASGVYKKLLECAVTSPSLKVYGRGSNSWLNHAKIFLAEGDDFARMSSSSANLSGSGISLHYDNWLFLESTKTNPVALGNICFFKSLKDMLNPEGRQDKGLFQKNQDLCSPKAAAGALQFLSTPTSAKVVKPLGVLIELIHNAKSTIRIAAHKITSPPSKKFNLVPALVEASKRGVKISVVFDDDTILKAKQIPGSEALNVSQDELAGYRLLKEAGADIRFIDTNEDLMTLMHNKYMIIDDNTVFSGAGNFSAASLNGTNTEQFYVIRIKELVDAYSKGWEELHSWALPEEHFSTPKL